MRNLACLFLFILCSCTATPSAVDSTFEGEAAYRFAENIQSFGPRIPGTENHRKASLWIEEQLTDCGWQVQEQSFVYRRVKLNNLLALRQDQLTQDTILLGAHYDTRPESDRDLTNPTAPVPGANDGASGVAVLLELACILQVHQTRAPVAIAFFDGEDSGGIDGWGWIVGSSHFAENLLVQPKAVIIVDMIGDANLQIYYERNSDQKLMQDIWETAQELGNESFIAEEKYTILDDHIPFLRLGIPSVDVIDFDYPYWHTTQDTMDKISADSLERVGRTLQAWLEK